MSKEAVLILISHLKDWLHQGLEILSEFQKAVEETPKEIIESPNSDFLTRKNKLLARLLKRENCLIVLPVESLRIKANDRAITWLKNQPLKAAEQKHGVKFVFEEDKGILRSIKLEGPQEELEKLLQPISWALEKAGY